MSCCFVCCCCCSLTITTFFLVLLGLLPHGHHLLDQAGVLLLVLPLRLQLVEEEVVVYQTHLALHLLQQAVVVGAQAGGHLLHALRHLLAALQLVLLDLLLGGVHVSLSSAEDVSGDGAAAKTDRQTEQFLNLNQRFGLF